MRRRRIPTQSLLPIGFVILVIAFVPDNLTVALKRENVSRDTI